jgi:SOS-response transcriptional repressor LexA
MSELQQAVLDFVHAHHESRHAAPTTAEVLQAFRFRNESSVVHTLEGLERAGQLTRASGRWRLKQPEVQTHLDLSADGAGAPKR